MSGSERRTKLTIDEVNVYWRALKDGAASPELHKLCNAIRTLDLALMDNGPALCKRLSSNIWSRLRNDIFDILLSSFPGNFLVYVGGVPLEAGGQFPDLDDGSTLEFHPAQMKRAEDSFLARLDDISPELIVRLRWLLAEGRSDTSAADFKTSLGRDVFLNVGEHSEEQNKSEFLIQEIYLTLASEAKKLKKIAHRRWWQLQSEASDCSDRKHKSALRREMQNLELVWGRG